MGTILLLSPIMVVVFQGSACSSFLTYCLGDNINKYVDAFLPYVMLAGGLFIGYSMKKIADSHIVEAEDESEPYKQS